MKTERDKIVTKIKTLLDISSDAQIKFIDEILKKVIFRDDFTKLFEPQSNNFTTNGKITSVDESGSDFGSLYRSPDND